jgi:hypothetical protein
MVAVLKVELAIFVKEEELFVLPQRGRAGAVIFSALSTRKNLSLTLLLSSTKQQFRVEVFCLKSFL